MAIGRNAIASLFVTLGANITDFERKMDKAGRKSRDVGKGFTNMGMGLTKAISVPLALLGGFALKASIEFETAFTGVRKTVNATEAEFAKFRKGIIEMSKQLPTAANEIAGVTEMAGQLGIKNEALLDFTRTMIDLGETTDLASNQAAKALARVANIMQTNQSKFRNMGSAIVELGNNLATTESEIVEMTLRLAGASRQIGLTEAETLGFAAALSSVGIRADAGGTAFSKVFIEISKAVSKGSKTLRTFADVAGMSIDQFAKAFKEDAAEAVISFVEGLGRVEERGGNLFEVLDKLGIQERRMIDALLRTANAGDIVRRSIDLSTRAWEENTALTEEAEKRYKTTAAQLKMVWNQAIAAASAIGDTMKGALLALISPLKGVFGWLEKIAIEFNGLDIVIRLTIGAFIALIAIVGPVLFSIGLMQKAIPILALGFAGLTKAVVTFRAALTLLAAHPIVLALTIIAAEIAYLSGLFDTAVEASTTFADLMERLSKKTKKASDAMIGWTKAQLEANAASLTLEIAEKKRVLRMAEQIAMARAARGESDNHSEVIRQLSTEITELNLQLVGTTKALKNVAEAEAEAGGGAGDLADEVTKVDEIYKRLAEDAQILINRQKVMGPTFNAAKEEVGLLEEAMIKLLTEGVSPLDEGYKKLLERLLKVREAAKFFTPDVPVKLAQPERPGPPETLDDPFKGELAFLSVLKRSEEETAAWAESIVQLIGGGINEAASVFLEGIGRMAAGKATMSDVLSAVMSTLGDMAVRVGKTVMFTGFAIEAVRKALTSLSGIGAIAAGAALIALGSFVKASLAGAASGGGGGGRSYATAASTSLGNYTPRLPREDRMNRFERMPGLDRDGTRTRDTGDVGVSERNVNVIIEPHALPSGAIEYSVRESARRAENRGTEVI